MNFKAIYDILTCVILILGGHELLFTIAYWGDDGIQIVALAIITIFISFVFFVLCGVAFVVAFFFKAKLPNKIRYHWFFPLIIFLISYYYVVSPMLETGYGT
jgi:hypothetical protein